MAIEICLYFILSAFLSLNKTENETALREAAADLLSRFVNKYDK